MKSIRRIIAALLLCAVLAAMISAASAKMLFKNGTGEVTKADAKAETKTETKTETKAEPKTPYNVFVSGGNSRSFYVPASSEGVAGEPGTVYVVNPNYSSGYPYFNGTYYSNQSAAQELAQYFADHYLLLGMKVGEERTYGKGVYLFSEDPTIATYNAETGYLRAVSTGMVRVYVFTPGGVPFYSLLVTVTAGTDTDHLVLEASDWEVYPGDTVTFTATSTGQAYSDVVYSITKGKENATITADGKLIALRSGPVLVHAQSKAHPAIYGEVFLYVGGITRAIAYGGWSASSGVVTVNSWVGDFDYLARIDGWIKNDDGIFIPVVKKETDVDIRRYDGVTKGTVITRGFVNFADLYSSIYGRDSSLICRLVGSYTLEENGLLPKGTVLNSSLFDNRIILLARMIDLIRVEEAKS